VLKHISILHAFCRPTELRVYGRSIMIMFTSIEFCSYKVEPLMIETHMQVYTRSQATVAVKSGTTCDVMTGIAMEMYDYPLLEAARFVNSSWFHVLPLRTIPVSSCLKESVYLKVIAGRTVVPARFCTSPAWASVRMRPSKKNAHGLRLTSPCRRPNCTKKRWGSSANASDGCCSVLRLP